MENKITILVFEPGKKPELRVIDNTLEAKQKVVQGDAPYGLIQALYPWDAPIALVCHDEGKPFDMQPNRFLMYENKVYDVIVGPCFICGAYPDDENFSSIPQEFVDRFMDAKQCRKLFPAV